MFATASPLESMGLVAQELLDEVVADLGPEDDAPMAVFGKGLDGQPYLFHLPWFGSDLEKTYILKVVIPTELKRMEAVNACVMSFAWQLPDGVLTAEEQADCSQIAMYLGADARGLTVHGRAAVLRRPGRAPGLGQWDILSGGVAGPLLDALTVGIRGAGR